MKINLPILSFALVLFMQTAGAIWWASSTSAQVEVSASDITETREEIADVEARIAARIDMEAARIASIEDAQGDLRTAFATIDAKLDALIERFDRAERSGRQNE